MHKFIALFILIFFPSLLFSAELPDHPPLFSYLLYPGGLEVIDGSTVIITANGINKKVGLNGSWEDDEYGRRILEKMISGRRTEVRIFGKDHENITVAILLNNDVNINREIANYGFQQQAANSAAGGKSNSISSVRSDSALDNAETLMKSYRTENGITDRGEEMTWARSNSYVRSSSQRGSDPSQRTQQVSGYWRKDGTYVKPYKRAKRGTLSGGKRKRR
ncbi:MAG: hypothetical protein QTN59_18300 [Candidatus Electrothrix communis]|nr:MAG: hypothetical protein QTN59_18300 [Candidatus Electrothrix communis]